MDIISCKLGRTRLINEQVAGTSSATSTPTGTSSGASSSPTKKSDSIVVRTFSFVVLAQVFLAGVVVGLL